MFKPSSHGEPYRRGMTTHEHLITTLTELAGVLDGIPENADHGPTPCTEFTVAELRGHVVSWLTAFTDGFENPAGQCSDSEATGVVGTGSAQVRELTDRLSRALPQAAERPLAIGGSAMPGTMAVSMILWEYQVHGWDLARSTEQEWSPDEAGLAGSVEFAPGMLTPDFQGPGKAFAPRVAVPADAPLLDTLLGLSGRDPQWQPRLRPQRKATNQFS